jgi:hypothetical protein
MASGGMTCKPSFMKIHIRLQAILRTCFSNLRDRLVGWLVGSLISFTQDGKCGLESHPETLPQHMHIL